MRMSSCQRIAVPLPSRCGTGSRCDPVRPVGQSRSRGSPAGQLAGVARSREGGDQGVDPARLGARVGLPQAIRLPGHVCVREGLDTGADAGSDKWIIGINKNPDVFRGLVRGETHEAPSLKSPYLRPGHQAVTLESVVLIAEQTSRNEITACPPCQLHLRITRCTRNCSVQFPLLTTTNITNT